jgi:hypothetical protein
VANIALPATQWLHVSFTLSHASIASIYLDGILRAQCNFPFVDAGASGSWHVSSAGGFAQVTQLASLHYFARVIAQPDMALLAGQQPPALVLIAPVSATDLRASAVFGTEFPSQPLEGGWKIGQSGLAGTGLALLGPDPSWPWRTLSYSGASSLDLGASAARWPASFGSRPGGLTVSSWHRADRFTKYSKPFRCYSTSDVDEF